ncbi:hypothetical protein PQR02_00155 [Paraburkholderia sediminicola]|uniref:Uncharacterized protein n=1 Tax=Paraburkholderia rhynchosiae TaxID=487049 RepID=A0ACC7NCJ4_9BURK
MNKPKADPAKTAATRAMKKWIENNIGGALRSVTSATPSGSSYAGVDLIDWGEGKLFEFYAFLKLLERIRLTDPGCTFRAQRLVKGQYIYNGSPGLANPRRSHVCITLSDSTKMTVWQSVEFVGLGAMEHASASTRNGDYHEADILIIEGPSPKKTQPKFRPTADDVVLLVECKFMPSVSKQVLRNMLGLRREMSFLHSEIDSPFSPAASGFKIKLPATRGTNDGQTSHLLLAYAFPSNSSIEMQWKRPSQRFGIEYLQLV